MVVVGGATLEHSCMDVCARMCVRVCVCALFFYEVNLKMGSKLSLN